MATPLSAHFFFFAGKMSKTYFFELLQANFTDLHETWHTPSVDSPEKSYQKTCNRKLSFWVIK